jgi:phytoene desaturase (3,4-didehydrolycopene-forming)
LVAVGERTGVKLNLSTPVKRVIVSDDGRATGIELENGKMEEADLVVVNADLVYAYEKLLPKSKYAEGLTKRQSSCSSISFYWAVDRQVKELGVHNIFLADDYEESFDSIFKDHTMPREPSFYINVPSRVDPTAAPEGCDSVVVLVPIGHITDGKTKQDFDALVNRARAHVFKVLAKQLGLKDFPSYIKQEFYNDPYTWREDLNLSKGSIRTCSPDLSWHNLILCSWTQPRLLVLPI